MIIPMLPLTARCFLRRVSTAHSAVLALIILQAANQAQAEESIPGPDNVGARQIPLSSKAYAGSSINVVAGSRQTLYTDGVHQFAGFYDDSGRLVLARRRLGEDNWQASTTEFSADTKDAHNTISLVADGEGYLHLAWGHHNTPLNYSRSLEPGGLVMGKPHAMIAEEPGEDARPRFNLVHRGERGWRTIPGPSAGRDFTLRGQGTKRPPLSRAALLVETGWNHGAHLIYRDDSRDGRVLAASLDDLSSTDPNRPKWHFRYLTEESVGGWEPSIDPTQWQRMKQAQLLLQPVAQLDGDDRSGSDTEPTSLNLLIWSPE